MSVQFPTDVVQQVNAVLEAWKKIDPNGQFGDLTQAKMAADLAQNEPLLTEMGALDAELTRVRNKRDALYATMWDEVSASAIPSKASMATIPRNMRWWAALARATANRFRGRASRRRRRRANRRLW